MRFSSVLDRYFSFVYKYTADGYVLYWVVDNYTVYRRLEFYLNFVTRVEVHTHTRLCMRLLDRRWSLYARSELPVDGFPFQIENKLSYLNDYTAGLIISQ